MPEHFADNILAALDVLLVAIIVYYILIAIREIRHKAILYAFGILSLTYILCQPLQLTALGFVVGKLLIFALVLCLVIFAPELRKHLETNGGISPFWRQFLPMAEVSTRSPLAMPVGTELSEAAIKLAQAKTGALIVVQMEDSVDSLAISGTPLDALVTSRLLVSIFGRHNPLHDGAVVIQNERIAQASCFLPISESGRVASNLGTRHRAALGLSERCDAVIIVVSEERGSLSIAHCGRLALDLTPAQFTEQLLALTAVNASFVTKCARSRLV